MKILVDMNLSHNWVGYLLENDIEVAHWSYIGSPNDPDTEIYNYAIDNDFIIFTNDLDFGFIHTITHNKKPSIIQLRTGVLGHRRIGDIVINTINNFANEIENGALVTIDKNKIRVTLLPL